MRHFKYIFSLVALLLCSMTIKAQPYGNEWIDFSKTYYKFKTGAEGIYRIPKSVLDAAGIPVTTTGASFILYRNGTEIPLYVTSASSFGSSDYIEFWGEKADGKMDTELYASPSLHPNNRMSLFTDSTAYFLTYDNGTNHLRYQNVTNNIPVTPPPSPAFCTATTGEYFTNTFMNGQPINNQEQIYLSLFDIGEGFVSMRQHSNTTTSINLNTPNVVSGGNAIVNSTVLRNSYASNLINLKINLNNQLIADSTVFPNATKLFSVAVSSAVLGSSNVFQFVPNTTYNNFDDYGVSYLEVQYPRNFDLSGLSYFNCTLSPSSSQQYLEFSNMATSTASRAYDVTNKKWYTADITQSGKQRFYLDASLTTRQLVIYADNSSNINNIVSLAPTNFTNYALAANQGDYIIITHRNLMSLVNGHNYIQDYKTYRISQTGGNRAVVVADVTELYDQFANGVAMHPLAIRHFLQYAYNTWTVKPHDVFLVGKGIFYPKYRTWLQSPSSYGYDAIVPTYGEPGADVDFVNFLPNRHQAMNIARLSAWTAQEVGNYLDKVKAYEQALASPILPQHETELWKKKILHAAGGRSIGEQDYFVNTLNSGAAFAKDTSFGAIVTTVRKNTTVPIDPQGSASVDSLINSGLSFIVYHGHSNPNGFEFNINNPEQYNNQPRLPHFLALGCDVAQIFSLSSVKTISERYVATSGGSVSMIASDNLQYPDFHSYYLPIFYNSVSQTNYGGSIGDHNHYAYDSVRNQLSSNFYFMHIESMLLQGDPMVKAFGAPKPDYHVAANRLSTIPANVTTSLDSFTLKIIAFNLAKAMKDTVRVKVEHTNPGNVTTLVGTYKIVNLYSTDTSTINVPIDKIADLGLNKYTVTIDDNNLFDEVSESNNTATQEIFIYSDNLIPVYPYEFSIVHNQGVVLKASTLNPFRGMGRYKMEIDTTALFNSSAKLQTTISSSGGVLKWTPSITLKDSTVYYWRTAFDSTVNGSYQWASSSFIYLANGSDGWNQSHYYQYLQDNIANLEYGNDRVFRYKQGVTEVTVSNAVYSEDNSTPWSTAEYMKVVVNGTDAQRLGCPPWGGTLQVMVFDSASNALWINPPGGASGAYSQCLGNTRNYYAFEFPVYNITGRNLAKHFIDSIPNGHFVLVRNIINNGAYIPSYVNDWKQDELINGTGNSLYHSLFNMGFTTIDSFQYKRVFTFIRKKNDSSFPVYQFITHDSLDKFSENILLPSIRHSGAVNSTIIGPAKAWQTLKWRTSAYDNKPSNDDPTLKITGIMANNTLVLLYNGRAKDTSLSFINASTYPYLKMEWQSFDSINLTSPQLDYWRVLYSPVPEAALNPSAHFAFTDSVSQGQNMNFEVAVENISHLPMDSMLVRYKVIDANGTTHTLASKRYKPLLANDTLHANYSFNPNSYPGKNVFFIEANPDNDQLEQYHPNNLGYLPFKIETDQRNPLIDVTFDGVHILDKDIVSAKPFIKIVLRDENKYLKLDDTSLLTLRIRYPNDIGMVRTVSFDGNVARFIPANGNKNEATIEYKPTLLEDGVYELLVNGKDKSGNIAGKSDYQVSFQVINKSSITNILNYPNPFSTSTAFVFTLTGAELPTQFKIQILTVTGKVVREITRQELGSIHVGRNITDYKWDGKDQYGQLLGNGVYLYRVVTAINGKDIEKMNSGADKFYKNGYGKMYIMR